MRYLRILLSAYICPNYDNIFRKYLKLCSQFVELTVIIPKKNKYNSSVDSLLIFFYEQPRSTYSM